MPRAQVFDDNGKIIHDEEFSLSHFMQKSEPRIMGLTVQTWATILGPVFAMALLYGHMEHVFKATDYLLHFAHNSDLYNSAKTGVQFEQGMPAKFNSNTVQVDPGVYKP